MRFHDVVALSGLVAAAVGVLAVFAMPGFRLIGATVALAGVIALAYGGSYL